MSNFRTGDFDRSMVIGLFRPFCPAQAVTHLDQINLDGLIARGKKLLMVDVDNTLVKWRSEDFTQETLDWIALAKSKGLQVCVISNTRNSERLERLSKALGVPTMRGRFKPSRNMFRQALEQFKVRPSEAIMVGDQLFTDILGANRAGVEAVWLKPVSEVDFGPTKINRFGERLLKNVIYQALTEPIDAEPADPVAESAKPLLQRTIVKQFIKFCIVGGTSAVIDVGLHFIMMFSVPWGDQLMSQVLGQWLKANLSGIFAFAQTPQDASVGVLKLISASVAIFNSFVWNRMWTYKIRGKEERMAQLRRFYVVSFIGLALNTLITTGLNNIIPGHPKRSLAVATAIAIVIVAIWNFSGQRLYAFKQRNK